MGKYQNRFRKFMDLRITRRFIKVSMTLLAASTLVACGVIKQNTQKGNPKNFITDALSQSNNRDELDMILAQSKKLSQGYDYDEALKILSSNPNLSDNQEILKLKQAVEDDKKKAIRYASPEKVTHIFFHSLIVNPSKAFDSDSKSKGYNQVMTTIDEFKAIIQEIYDRGYVLVSPHDLVKEVKNADGTIHFEPGDIYLPKDKIPFVLSQDDLNYYKYMDIDGFARYVALDEMGRPTTLMEKEGQLVAGDYDLVPIIESFIEKHPDFSYRGARGVLAITGYEGVMGYRTDPDDNLDETNRQEEIKKAIVVANGLKKAGWEFASHSWGHLNMPQVSFERFQADTDKWDSRVKPIVGDTNLYIYPFGADVYSEGGYTDNNAKYQYLASKGFSYFFPVDGSKASVQYGDSFYRQGRRNIDGYRMYYDMTLNQGMLDDLIDVPTVFDKTRPTPVAKMDE